MRDSGCIAFLQWALPRLKLRWAGFRKPRRQVCRRISRRFGALGLSSFDEYRLSLESEAGEEEWPTLDGLCRVTISRFLRDRVVWEGLVREVLPELARVARTEEREALCAWSLGCASGEEPYSLRLVWHFELTSRFPDLELVVRASDADEHLLERARASRYPAGCLRELPEHWKREAFRRRRHDELFELREAFRDGVEFRCEDLREIRAEKLFDLIFCRNLAWTYFEEGLQIEVLDRIAEALRPGGVLVIGGHESLPEHAGFESCGRSLWRRKSPPPTRG